MRGTRILPAGAALLCFFFTLVPSGARAGVAPSSDPPPRSDLDYAQVLFVEAVQSPDGRWCVYTTVRHNDEGWDHYANAWQVRDLEGTELAWRLLAHPHDEEQPFERDQCGITIAPGLTEIVVRAKCNVHGFGGGEVTVDLTVSEGEHFKVMRNK